ncbi:nuclear transport factor 2 family protein [Flavobacterium sp. AS60]|uniref:nuclear transport factor 2 family protein n=1 Tax=Flavobacterium anseongense TaxID=2910677 RepID=UPI001F4227EA|nr:nuclear transport factor 2 family protein [Flavobacterium sp. AS60]MCF6130057.1 nuclear transport factor 2 family protein [Flavobacterium sp. AS60]
MKQLTLLIILLATSTLAKAQKVLSKDQLEVQKTVVEFFEALSNRDSIALKKVSASDLVLYEYGEVWNCDTLIRKAIKLNTATDFNRINKFDFISTTVTKNTAWTSYNLHSEIIRNGQKTTIHWLETIIAVRNEKRWQIKVLHSTLIKRTP